MALCDIGKKFVTRAMFFRSTTLVGLILLSSCAQNAERDSVCKQSARWNNASTQIAVVLESIESTESGLIQNAFVETVDALLALNESAPREIKSDIENLLGTYGSLSDAFEAIDWQGDYHERIQQLSVLVFNLQATICNRRSQTWQITLPIIATCRLIMLSICSQTLAPRCLIQ